MTTNFLICFWFVLEGLFIYYFFLLCVLFYYTPEMQAEQWPWCHMFPMETLPCLGNETQASSDSQGYAYVCANTLANAILTARRTE